MKRNDLISSGVFFGVGLLIILYSPQFDLGSLSSPGPGFMPFLSGVIVCGFASVTFLGTFRDKSASVEKVWGKVNFRKLIFVLLLLCAYAGLLKPLGFIICSFFLILILMHYIGLQPWFKSILGAGLSSIMSYLLFETWLKSELPRGILGF
jgi:putative tricarboxylic transport membrane protein